MRKIALASAVFLGLLLWFLLFFRPAPLPERQWLEAESEMHKVKRITQHQIEDEARRVGDSLVSVADSLLHARLAALGTDNVAAALKQYPPQQYPEVQAIARKYTATPSRTGQKLSPAAQVKPAGQTEILYTKGIYLNNALCLQCHGVVGPEVSEATLATLQQAYPGFKATGFRTGEAIGSWQIKMARHPILENLSRSSRKSLRPQ
ncbi:MAG: hypothetical protein JWQ14_2118 [Adhaeribacter sp.]|nr:hypothetical protein [Adhaeribacter sp.]